MNLRIVTREREVELTFRDLDLTNTATDAQIRTAAEKYMDAKLTDLVVSRQGENILLSTSPIFG
jgi:hypothetical protein